MQDLLRRFYANGPRTVLRRFWFVIPVGALFGGCTKAVPPQDICSTRAFEGCLCYDDGTCEPGLVCNQSNWCEVPGGVGGSNPGSGGTGNPAGGTSSAGGSVPGGGTPGAGGTNVNPSGGTGVGGSPPGSGGTGASAGTGGTGTPTPTDIYASPSGVDSNPGTMDQPVRTIIRGWELAGPTTTIWVMPGTHVYNIRIQATKSGTQANPIKIYAMPGSRPVFDFSTQPRNDDNSRGIEIRGSWWHIKGIEVYNAGDNGIRVSGNNNVIEDVVARANDDTGIQIMGTTDADGANNLVLNCDSYDNFDEANNGENADGFAAKERIGPGNVFRGCRAWNNADDGWDFFAADEVVRVEDSWAFENGIVDGDNSAGDGNGFKLGGDPSGIEGGGHAAHVVTGSASFDNRECGYTRNNNTQSPSVTNSKANGNNMICCDGQSCSGVGTMSTSASTARTMQRNSDGSLPAIN